MAEPSARGSGSEAPVCGVLLVDKPAGITSHDVVYRVRRATGIKKVGHAGTLDPFATGLLLMLVGKATRLFDYFTPLDKEYRVTVQFGAASTTGDIDGEITPAREPGEAEVARVAEAESARVTEAEVARVTETTLRAVLPEFTGKIKQRAHAYSAVKVGGEPLYRKARRGEAVEAPVRDVEIHRLDLEAFDEERQQAVLTVGCSKGTYIRSLCEDLAGELGTSAYAASLRRTRSGDFSVEAAVSLEELGSMPRESLTPGAAASFLSCLGALYFLPVREVDEIEARAVATGRAIGGTGYDGPVRIAHGERLLAIGGPDGEGRLRPLVVLA